MPTASRTRYTVGMRDDIDQVIIGREAIAARVAALAGEITRDLVAERDVAAAGVEAAGAAAGADLEITLVPILAGSFIFVADLIRHLPMRLQIRMLAISSYPGTATSSRGARVRRELTNLPATLAGRHVLVIDDILDSGSTLRAAVSLLRERDPVSVRTCVLLRKQRPDAMNVPVDYVAFDVPDQFVVGYGLDYDDYYRNLPDIVTLRPEIYR